MSAAYLSSDELAAETNPDSPEDHFVVKTAIEEMRASAKDALWFTAQMQRNEETRLNHRPGKTGTGRKRSRPGAPAMPWEDAPDHDNHLTQEVINRRNAMRVAALSRGNLNVTPTGSTASGKAAKMKSLLRYYLNGPMKSQVLTHGTRAGSWADRWGHSILYIGWKEERGVEPLSLALPDVVQQLQARDAEANQGMTLSAMTAEDYVNDLLMPGAELVNAQRIADLRPGLKARGVEGIRQARKALRVWQKDRRAVATVHASFVKKSAPLWEAKIPFVDVFYPAEAVFDDNMDGCRWVGTVKWMSEQQIREQAAIENWNEAWVKEVLKNHKGKSTALSNRNMGWMFSATGVGWSALNGNAHGGETQKHLYQIVELWDRSMTSDGLTGTYHTVMHADVNDKVAIRRLRADWQGCLPFVAFTCEKDEKRLLASRGIPEFTATPQDAIKVQWDARSCAASLTTVPPWTGPAELAGMTIAPGKFIPQSRGGITVQPWTMPPPDGRSIEVEKTLRASVDRLFGMAGDAVPDAVSMAMAQADMDWYLAGISQAMKLTAQLIQQYSPEVKNARISGSDEMISATADEVRGSYDFETKFDVRALDLEWATAMLKFVKDMLIPLDRRGDIDTFPLMEVGFNLLDGSLTPRCLPGKEITQRRQLEEERGILADIFSSGTPVDVPKGIDYGGRAHFMVDDLKRSPERQQALMSSPQKFIVFTNRLKSLLDNQQQYGENITTGQTLAPDPMEPKDAPHRVLAFLESLKVDMETPPEELIQALPYLQQVLNQDGQA